LFDDLHKYNIKKEGEERENIHNRFFPILSKMKGFPMMFILSECQTPLFAKLILSQDHPIREGHDGATRKYDGEKEKNIPMMIKNPSLSPWQPQ
jgi:hypothetical protein